MSDQDSTEATAPTSLNESKGRTRKDFEVIVEQLNKRDKAVSENLSEFLSDLTKLVADGYKEASLHLRTVISVGYIGLFTVWGLTRTDLEPWALKAVALSLTLSLVWFVIHEISSVLFVQSDFKKRFKICLRDLEKANKDKSKKDFSKVIEELRQQMKSPTVI